jgi:hypothetical protein
MKRAIIYKATDGKGFETVEECREYERSVYINRLSGLSVCDILDAIEGKNKELAITIKKVANLIPTRLRSLINPRVAEALSDPTGKKAGELLAQKLKKIEGKK